MLRIAIIERAGDGVRLRLEGRVIGPWVDELRRVCASLSTGRAGLTLDLGEVSFIDRDGIELFRILKDQNAALLNCSPFVAEQLKAIEAPVEGRDHGG